MNSGDDGIYIISAIGEDSKPEFRVAHLQNVTNLYYDEVNNSTSVEDDVIIKNARQMWECSGNMTQAFKDQNTARAYAWELYIILESAVIYGLQDLGHIDRYWVEDGMRKLVEIAKRAGSAAGTEVAL